MGIWTQTKYIFLNFWQLYMLVGRPRRRWLSFHNTGTEQPCALRACSYYNIDIEAGLWPQKMTILMQIFQKAIAALKIVILKNKKHFIITK